MGAILELRAGDGNTPFLSACRSNAEYESIKLLELLFVNGADLKAVTSDGSCAVRKAAYKDKTESILFLNSKGVYMDKADNEGGTPIMIACQYGHLDAA